ncbi:hypothetical protein PTKIN_Ptkin06aG0127000 [Pterospermum kingtungense]
MASTFSHCSCRLHNFCLPPISSLNIKANGVATAPPKKPLNLRLKLKIKIPNHAKEGDSSVVGETNGSHQRPTFHHVDSLVLNNQTTQPNPACALAKNKRCLSVTLSKREIEEDIVAIEALNGSKRLRRPKKLSSNINKRQLDHLFPSLG